MSLFLSYKKYSKILKAGRFTAVFAQLRFGWSLCKSLSFASVTALKVNTDKVICPVVKLNLLLGETLSVVRDLSQQRESI